MTKGVESWKEMRKFNEPILDSRTGINSEFIPGTQCDAPEFYQFLLNKFCGGKPNFKSNIIFFVVMGIIQSLYEMNIVLIFLSRIVSGLQKIWGGRPQNCFITTKLVLSYLYN